MTNSTPVKKRLEHAAHRAGSFSPVERACLWDMEERFWTSGADSARASTAPDAVMIVPYPPGILQSDRIWSHLHHWTGWRSVVMAERRVTRRHELAILTYRVSAEKPAAAIFTALCASTYFHDDDSWLRLSHQQTAVA
nr:hypothetical protein [Nitrosomonas nitrosa]